MIVDVLELTCGWLISKVKNFRYYGLERYFSVIDNVTKDRVHYGLYEDDRYYRVPKVSEITLCGALGSSVDVDIRRLDVMPYTKFNKNIKLKNPPKNDIQAEVIQNVLSAYASGRKRAIISLPTGRGKTYVATNIMTQLNTPTLVLVKSITLRDQWLDSFIKHTNINPNNNIATCMGSNDIVTLIESGVKYDVIIVTHSTVRSFIKRYSIREFNKMLLLQGIGLKIYDEFDLENDSMFTLDTHTNIDKTLYLSATVYKSPTHNTIFQSIFSTVPNFGDTYELKPDRVGVFVTYDSKPTRAQFNKCSSFRVSEFVFDYHKYHKYIVDNQAYMPALKKIWYEYIKEKYTSKEYYSKTVFFIGRKVTAEKFRNDIIKELKIDPNDVSILNSDTPANIRETSKNKKIIISTSDSLGRGVDLQGLDVIVDLETRGSLSKTTQVVGRVSREGAKRVGMYFSFIDIAFPTVIRNHRYKLDKGFYETLFTEIKTIEI